MEMMLEVMLWVLDMEVDKVANLMDKFITYTSGATWWPNFRLMQVVPPGS